MISNQLCLSFLHSTQYSFFYEATCIIIAISIKHCTFFNKIITLLNITELSDTCTLWIHVFAPNSLHRQRFFTIFFCSHFQLANNFKNIKKSIHVSREPSRWMLIVCVGIFYYFFFLIFLLLLTCWVVILCNRAVFPVK